MKYLSLFSGIGGFELGIEQAYEDNKVRLSKQRQKKLDNLQHKGDSSDIDDSDTIRKKSKSEPINTQNLDCIGYSEIDKYAIQVYNKHFNHKNYGDITKIKSENLPDFDLLVGGFPCQAFSIAGKRGGFRDTRGTLFFEIARIIEQRQPRLLLLENVKGLLSHDKGGTFTTIISTLDELGYDCQWQVLNSKNFGVPQNRERVFIIGHIRGTSRPEVFPITETNRLPNAEHQIRFGKFCGKATTPDGFSATLTRNYGELSGDSTKIIQINNPKHSNDRVYSDDGISPTLNTMQGGRRQPFVAPVITPDRPNKRQNGRRMKENGDPSFTLTAQDKHGIYDGMKIRRLTPKECERLQGFPDDWTEGLSDTQRYKCLGNAVTVNVIKEIMLNIIN